MSPPPDDDLDDDEGPCPAATWRPASDADRPARQAAMQAELELLHMEADRMLLTGHPREVVSLFAVAAANIARDQGICMACFTKLLGEVMACVSNRPVSITAQFHAPEEKPWHDA